MVYTNEANEEVSRLYLEYLRTMDTLLFHQVLIEAGRAELLGSREALEPARKAADEAYQKYFEAEVACMLEEVKERLNVTHK